MKLDKRFIFLLRVVIMIFLIPIMLFAILFSRFFDKALRKAIRVKGPKAVQLLLNWKGIRGIFELGRELR
jgi:hypothetical protein